MQKPQPSHEIIIKSSPGASYLDIWTYSGDASDWINENAHEFGSLRTETTKQVLFVSPGYDVGEVRDYLLSYNDNEAENELKRSKHDGLK